MVDKTSDEKEALELKKFYNLYFDKCFDIMKKNPFQAEDEFGDILSEDSISSEHVTKTISFLAKTM